MFVSSLRHTPSSQQLQTENKTWKGRPNYFELFQIFAPLILLSQWLTIVINFSWNFWCGKNVIRKFYDINMRLLLIQQNLRLTNCVLRGFLLARGWTRANGKNIGSRLSSETCLKLFRSSFKFPADKKEVKVGNGSNIKNRNLLELR